MLAINKQLLGPDNAVVAGSLNIRSNLRLLPFFGTAFSVLKTYWSSALDASNNTLVFVVDFNAGDVTDPFLTDGRCVYAVRDGR